MEKCLEKILDDVVRIDIYKMNDITFSVPFNAMAVTEISCTLAAGALPVLTMNLSGDVTEDVLMEPSPKIQTTEKREVAGRVLSHTIEAVVTDGLEAVKNAADRLVHYDSVPLLTTYDGTKYVINPFPNTSVFSITDTRQQSHTMSVKYQAQSFSGLIEADVSSSSDDSD